MWLRLSGTPAWWRNVSQTKNRPRSSMQKATGLASSGSAANRLTLVPGATLNSLAAWDASGEAGATSGLYDISWARDGRGIPAAEKAQQATRAAAIETLRISGESNAT